MGALIPFSLNQLWPRDITTLIVYAVCVLIALTWIGAGGKTRRKWRPKFSPIAGDDQLRAVSHATFNVKRLMNGEEFKIYRYLRSYFAGRRGYLIFSQVSLGEMLRTNDEEAFRSINSKRSDFVITDKMGEPIAVVEHQGSGHYQGDAALRDKVKATALKSSGIALIETFPSDDELSVHRKLNMVFQ